MVPSVEPPAPVLVEGELEYIVEKILDSRVSRRKLQYLVKWKGYAQEDNSWVFASDVHAPDLVRAFHVAHPGRPGGSVRDLTSDERTCSPKYFRDYWAGARISALQLTMQVDNNEIQLPKSQEEEQGGNVEDKVVDDIVTDPTWQEDMQSKDSSTHGEGGISHKTGRKKQCGVPTDRRHISVPRNTNMTELPFQVLDLPNSGYFLKTLLITPNQAICSTCHARISRGSKTTSLTTTSMIRHMAAKQPTLWDEPQVPGTLSADYVRRFCNIRQLICGIFAECNRTPFSSEDIVPVYQIKGISKLVKLCLPKVQCFCDSLTSPPSERQARLKDSQKQEKTSRGTSRLHSVTQGAAAATAISPLSTSSESDFGTTRTSFLEQRQNRQSRGKRGGGSGNVRLKAHFSRIPERVSAVTASSEPIFKLDNLKLRVRSSFQPPRIYHPVETYVDFVKQDVKSVLESIEQGQIHVKQNLTRDEHLALVSLKNNRQLIIKPADKGGSIVVLDRDYYMQEIRTQLSDLGTYRLVSSNPTFDIARVIKGFIDHHLQEGSIDEKLGDYLFNQHPVLPVFYTLPKIHKHSTRPPGRPIVASTNSLLSPLAITLEKILSPLVPRIKSFLKDTSQFLESLQNVGPLPEDCLLVTMDVNSLYTSIGHQDGIKAVMSFLEEHTQFSSQQKSFCRDLLTLILTKKIFIFEDQFFLQERGTAMGSNMAPPYANIFMDQFEITFVYSHPSFISFASYWRRYIDDIFLIWTGDSETLEAFHDDLNSSLEGLTFSISSSTSSMNFLDTLFSVSSDRVLETDLYVKPTDRNSLLKFVSCHPKHIKVSLPRSQHARIDRIVSKPDVCRMRHHEMDSKFRTRGYPTHVLDTQQRIIRTREKHNVPRIAFVSTYHPFNHLINSIQEGIPARTPLGRRMRSSIFDFGSVRRHSAFPNCTLLTYAPPLKWEFHPYTKADK
ncbi:unnamed protein product [Ranitomeya imitator]|uniref:Chromo domain-containing protein n=1 Tax=Ranitomeya imitator TaxID=111125 RepID=A0ABN9LK15_9NEOB|nr:unnamed protein product [Ranitomeya imitator]